MYYSEEIIEEVRQRNDIVSVISSYVRLQKKGGSYMGLCPFHSEKTPSFSVSGSRQMYHCFGCGVGGNVFTFLMEYENFSFIEAVQHLAERGGVKLPEVSYSEEGRRQADLRSQLLEINKQAAKYFYYQLKSKQGETALQYLQKRNLSMDTIKKFGLGYSNKYKDDLYQYLKGQGYADELLNQSGLVSIDEARGAQDKFWNRVIFPIMDINHKVIGFGGRVMGDGMPKYLNSPETKIFDKSRNLYGLNLARQARTRQIILCEGYMDVIALHQAGFGNAVASLGTAFTGLQANLLKRYADEILLTYDSDGAGVKATLRAIPMIKEAGLTAKVVRLAPYKDPDEFIKALGAEEFQKRLDSASNGFYFEIEILEKQFNFQNPEEKTKFFHELAKKLLVFTEELERNNYIEAMARKYSIPLEQLRKLVNKYGAQITVSSDYERNEKFFPNKKKHEKEDGIKQSQKLFLTWLIEDTSLFDKIKDIVNEKDFIQEPYHTVAHMLFAQYEENGQVNPAQIINYFESKEEQKEAASLFQTTLHQVMGRRDREKAFNEIVQKIKKHTLEEKSKKVTDIQELQDLVKEQKKLQSLYISLGDSES